MLQSSSFIILGITNLCEMLKPYLIFILDHEKYIVLEDVNWKILNFQRFGYYSLKGFRYYLLSSRSINRKISIVSAHNDNNVYNCWNKSHHITLHPIWRTQMRKRLSYLFTVIDVFVTIWFWHLDICSATSQSAVQSMIIETVWLVN